MARTPDVVKELICIAGTGDVDAAKTVLRRNSDGARDWRPIMEASYKGFPEIVKVLVKHGADVNALSTAEHNRPLHRAIEQGHADVVDVLLSSGADIEARATWLKIAPLAKAAFEGRPSIVDLLINRGAKVDRFAAAAIGRVGKAVNGED